MKSMEEQTPQAVADLARYFQAQYFDFSDDLPLYSDLASQGGGPILELGCGTGRILLRLAAKGFAVTGLDQDRSMLTRLANQLGSLPNTNLNLIQAKLQMPPLAGRFPLIISPCSTMAYLPEVEFNSTLASLRSLISREGKLAMDLPTPAGGPLELSEGPVVEWFHEPERGTDVQVSAEQRQVAQSVIEVVWHYDEMTADGRIKRRSLTNRYHLRSIGQLEKSLASNGFELDAVYGDYDRTAYTPDSPGLILIARPG